MPLSGNFIREKHTIAGKPYEVLYEYDLADRISKIRYPSGRYVTYFRDAEGRLTNVRTEKDSSSPSEAIIYTGMQWRPMSNLIKYMKFRNDLKVSNTWNNDYLHKRIRVYKSTTNYFDRTIVRNGSYKTHVVGITDALNSANDQSFTNTLSNRLSSAKGPWGAKSYTYGGTGNRTSESTTPSGGSTTVDTYGYTMNTNRLAGISQGGPDTRTFAYDAAGNVISASRPDPAFAYTYNDANRLKSVSFEGNLRGTYTYNGRSQLAIRTITNMGADNGTIHTVADLWGNIILEADDTGQTLREYLWIPEVGHAGTSLPIAIVDDVDTASPVTYYVHTDHLSRPVMISDLARNFVWKAEWQPWGELQSVTGTLATNQRFPGQWFQLEAGLHYNWHRHYDPTIGRYTQPDPLGFVDGPSQYAYAGSNVLFLVDPTGLTNSGGNGPKMPPAANDNGPRNMPGTQTDFRPAPLKNTKPSIEPMKPPPMTKIDPSVGAASPPTRTKKPSRRECREQRSIRDLGRAYPSLLQNLACAGSAYGLGEEDVVQA